MLKTLDGIGRLVIPKKIRTQLGISSDTLLSIEVVNGVITVTPMEVSPQKDNDNPQ